MADDEIPEEVKRKAMSAIEGVGGNGTKKLPPEPAINEQEARNVEQMLERQGFDVERL